MVTPGVAGNARRVHPGGLLRCCCQTIRECEASTVVGEMLTCLYCSARVVVAPDGAWIWERALAHAFPDARASSDHTD